MPVRADEITVGTLVVVSGSGRYEDAAFIGEVGRVVRVDSYDEDSHYAAVEFLPGAYLHERLWRNQARTAWDRFSLKHLNLAADEDAVTWCLRCLEE